MQKSLLESLWGQRLSKGRDRSQTGQWEKLRCAVVSAKASDNPQGVQSSGGPSASVPVGVCGLAFIPSC